MDMNMDHESRRSRMCNLCNAHFSSEKEYNAHFSMHLHKFMTTVKRTQQSIIGEARTLGEQIIETGKKEPLIGLEYIYEYAEDDEGVRMYECKLCKSAYRAESIFFHVVGIQHRILYLAEHHPIMGIDSRFEVLQQGQYRKLANNALAIEQTHGRKKINASKRPVKKERCHLIGCFVMCVNRTTCLYPQVVNEVYVSKPDVCEVSDTESIPEITEENAKEVSELQGEDGRPPRKMSKSKRTRKERRARERLLKLQEESDARDQAEGDRGRSRQRDSDRDRARDSDRDRARDNDRARDSDRDRARDRDRDRDRDSPHDSREKSRSLLQDEDFDARTLQRARSPVSPYDRRDDARVQGLDGGYKSQSRYRDVSPVHHSDSRDNPKYQQDTVGSMAWQYRAGGGTEGSDSRLGSLLPHSIGNVPSYQREQEQERSFLHSAVPPVSTTLPLVGGGSTAFPLVGGGSTAFPLVGGGSTAFPLVGGGSTAFPLVGGGSTAFPLVGGGSTAFPLVGGGSTAFPLVGGGSTPFPLVGGGSTAFPLVGGGSTAFPLVGGGSTAFPLVGGGNSAFPLVGGGNSAFPLVGGGSSAFPLIGGGSSAPPLVGGGSSAPPLVGGGSSAPSLVGGGSSAPPPVGGGGDSSTLPVVKYPPPLTSSTTYSLVGGGSTTPSQAGGGNSKPPDSGSRSTLQDDFDDVDLRVVKRDHGKDKGNSPSRKSSRSESSRSESSRSDSRSSSHKGSSSTSSSTKDQSRRRTYLPDNRTRHIENRRDKGTGDVDVRSVLPSGGVSFKELRTAYEANPQMSFSSEDLPLCKKKKEKETDSDMDVCSMDMSDCEPGDFWDSEELFDFLKCYHIDTEEDVKFILNATKQMSDALLRYKTRKEDLQKRILEAKVMLETEKKVFSNIKKRKEDWFIAGIKNKKNDQSAENSSETPLASDSTVAAIQKFRETASKSLKLISAQKAAASGAPKPQEKDPQQVTQSAKAIVAGLGPLLQRLFQNVQDSDFRSRVAKASVDGKRADSDRLSNQNPGSHLDTRGPGAVLKPGSEPIFDISPDPRPRYDNSNPSKDERMVTGQGAGRYSESGSRLNPNEQFPGSKIDSSGSFDRTKPPLGAGSEHFRQTPGSRFDNTDPSKDIRPLMGPGAGKYPEPDSPYNQKPLFPVSRVDNSGYPERTKLLPGAGPESRFSQSQGISGSRYDNPGPYNEARPMLGQGAGRYSEPASLYKQNEQFPGSLDKTNPLPGAGYNQSQGLSGSRLDNPGLSKEPRPLLGQGAGRYSEPDGYYKQNEQFPGSRVDNSGYYEKTKLLPGSGFNQTQGMSDARFDNLGPSKEARPMLGQGAGRYSEPDSPYNQKPLFPVSRVDNSGYPDKTKLLPGAGFSQSGVSGSRFDNLGPSKEALPMQGAGRYSESDSHYKQNEQFPGSRVDNSGYYEKTKPPAGAGFNQTPGSSVSRFNDPGPSREPRPMGGQGAGSYSETDSRYNQKDQFPGSWNANSGSYANNTKPPLGADMEAKYKQWNNGPQTAGNQGVYNDARTASGMGGGRYGGEQYTQNQWQSQTNSRGALSEAKPGPGSQSHQPAGSQSQQPAGSQSYQSAGSQSYQSGGSQSQQPAGSQSYQSAGSQSYQPKGSQSYQSAGSQSQQPAGSQSYQSAGSQSYQSAGSQSYQSAGSQSYQSAGSQSYQPKGSQSYQSAGSQSQQSVGSQSQQSAGSQSYQPPGSQSYQPPGSQSYQPSGSQSYRPAGSQNYQPTGSQSYQQTGSQSYQPAGSQSYQPSGSQSYQPSGSQSYQPSGFQSYQPPGSQSYQTSGSQSYQPPGSQSYQPSGSQSYQPPGSQSYQQTGAQSYQPTGAQSLQPAGSQSQQPTDSTKLSSDSHQSTWGSQDPPKAPVYPRSILKNKTTNLS